MLHRFARKPRANATSTNVADSADPGATAPANGAFEIVIRDLAIQATGLGREAADLCGVLDDVRGVAHREIDAFQSLSGEIGSM